MSSASRADAGAVPTWVTSLAGTGRCWRRFSSLTGRLLGSEFDSTPRLRHFPGQPRRSAKSVRMSEMRLVVVMRCQCSIYCAVRRVARSGCALEHTERSVRCCRTSASFGAGLVPAHGAPEPSRSVREDDLVKMHRDPRIRRKCQPAAQPWTFGRSGIEPIADDDTGVRIHMAKLLQ